MASDDSGHSAGSSRRDARAPRYRALRMSSEPRLRDLTPGVLSPGALVSPLPVVPTQHPVEVPPPAVPQLLESVLPAAPTASSPPRTLTWERPDQAPIARAMGNGPMGRLVVGYLREVAGVDGITIVCLCHGASFSPAGFLEHAGAANLSYPLKRIMISYPEFGGPGPSAATGNGGSGGQE